MSEPTIGHNMLADQQDVRYPEMLLAEAEELSRIVDTWRAEVSEIEDEQRAAECSDLLDKLRDAMKTATAEHRKEKRPLLDACAACDDRYRPITSLLEAATKPVQDLLSIWIQKLRIIKTKKAADLEAEAERYRRAAEAAKNVSSIMGSLAAQVAFDRAERSTAEAAKAANSKAQAKGTLGGRAKTLRTTWHAAVTNYPLACRHYTNHPDVISTLERIASAEARGGARILPGFKVFEKETVA